MRNNRKRTLQILTTSGLLLLGVSIAQAGTLVTIPGTYGSTLNLNAVTSGTCLGLGYDTPSGPCSAIAGATLDSTLSVTGPSDTLTFDVNGAGEAGAGYSGQDYQVWQDVTSAAGTDQFFGKFTGTPNLIGTQAQGETNGIVIDFNPGISNVGFYVQDNNYTTEPFDVFITLSGGTDSGTCDTFESASCEVESLTPNSGPVFIGAQAASGTTFTQIQVTTCIATSTSNATCNSFDNNFFIGDLAFTVGATNSSSGPPPSTPEPSTIAMMVGGLGVLGWKARKRVKA
jgi:hypothetical protein